MRLLFVLGFWALLAGAQAQSGWTRAKNSWYAKTDLALFRSDTYYNPAGDKVQTAEFAQNSVNLYGEYGLTNRWTALLSWPVLRTNAFERTETVVGVGDLRLETKYRFTGSQWPVSVSLAVEMPTGRANALAENEDFPGNFINLPTGDGEWNLWATAAASKSFGKVYGSLFAAYDFRTQYQGLAFQDLYQFGAEVGYNPWAPLWLVAKLRTQYSTGESQHPAELGFLRGDATQYTAFNLESSWRITGRWGIALSFSNVNDLIAPLENLYAAPTYTLGVFFVQE